MKISFEEIQRIRELNLPEIMARYGIAGSSNHNGTHTYRCPFHDDKTPSLKVNLKGGKWLWHCFGCGAGGNVINFVMKYERVTIKEVLERLTKKTGPVPKLSGSTGASQGGGRSMSELMERVIRFYQETLQEDRRGVDYLVRRGIKDAQIYREYGIGYVNGSMKRTLPEEGPVLEHLKEQGILNSRGQEFFYQCVVFPVTDENGVVVGVYGRNIERPGHLYLPGPHRGVFNGQVVKTSRTIYVTESIIDCVSLIELGIRNVVPLYGTNGLTPEHLNLFKKHLTKEIVLCLDNDEAGRSATEKVGKELLALGIRIWSVTLPDGVKDMNDYLLLGKRREDFEGLERRELTVPPEVLSGGPKITEEETQVVFDYGERSYRVRGLSTVRMDQMKVNIKVTGAKGYHLDSVDLYSSRGREGLIGQVEKVLGLDQGRLRQDLTLIVDHLEGLQARQLTKSCRGATFEVAMSEEEKGEALGLLQSPDLFDGILEDFKVCGHIGEENNLLLGYLAGISRKLSTPLAVLVVSRSASGKTTLQDAILSFTPPEDYEKYTRLTDQALFYQGEDALKNKLLAIEEERGASGSAYSLRNLQSSQGLSIAATTKDVMTGKLKTDVYKVKGPTAIMITTTYSEAMDFETYNRFIILTVDESIDQTRKILERQRLNESIEGIMARKRRERIQRRHHNAQRLLRVLEVANPYSSRLTFMDTILRARREQPKYLALIKTVALLRQYQKDVKNCEGIEYIEVDLTDIGIANRIANATLGRNLDELCPPARNLLVEIERMVQGMAQAQGIGWEEIIFTRREVRESTRWSEYQVRMHMRQLEELEYIYPVNGRQGQRYAYKLLWDGRGTKGESFVMGLKDVAELRA